jgi:hypothetical protein
MKQFITATKPFFGFDANVLKHLIGTDRPNNKPNDA